MAQVLTFVDEEGPVVGGAMHRLVEESSCPQDHALAVAALLPLVRANGDGQYDLNSDGEEWLLEVGRPASDWLDLSPETLPQMRKWQVEALDAWAEHGRHGVVEAVTGTGKSRVGIEAIREGIRHDYSCIVVVPTVELVGQWRDALRRHGVQRVATSADAPRTPLDHCDVLVATVQSLYLSPPSRDDGKVLLVADECHRYGAEQWSKVLHPSYRRRLGLTATFERADDGIDILRDYFGGECVYRIGFGRAMADDVIARYSLDLVPVQLSVTERARYDEAHEAVVDSRAELLDRGLPESPFGEFLAAVQIAAADDEPDYELRDLARRYLSAFSQRLSVMSNARSKMEAARRVAPLIKSSRGALLFTRRVSAAEEITQILVREGVPAAAVHSDLSGAERRDRLADLRAGRLRAVVAPTVLDEGIDVPDVDLGVVLGGSQSRRQMIQRMGRVLRRKNDGRPARFVLVYAAGTVEDVSAHSGEEGCLDLLVRHADSVREDGVLAPIAHLPVAGHGAAPGVTREEPRPLASFDSVARVEAVDKRTTCSVVAHDGSDVEGTRGGAGSRAPGDAGASRGDGHRSLLEAVEADSTSSAAVTRTRVVTPTAAGEEGPEPVVVQLERLAALRSSGMLTEEEFSAAKKRVLQL